MSWNVIDYTCGIVPVTTVLAEETHYNMEGKCLVRDKHIRTMESAMKNAIGLPVSV